MISETKSSLQLGKIILKNYRTYKGDVIVELSRDLQKTITVIHGEMGYGKTTILGAVYWCLYGVSRLADPDSDEGIINSNVLNNLGIADFDETLVEIELYEENELCYKIKRVIEFSKKSESSTMVNNKDLGGRIPAGIAIESKIEFSYLPQGSSDWETYNDSDRIKNAIDNLFPQSLSKYFLFDAELLDNFFDISDEKNIKVKDGIEKISGLPIIDSSINHLNKISSYIQSNTHGPDLEPITNEITLLKKKIESEENKIQKEIEIQKKLRIEIETTASFLRNHNEDDIKETQKRIEKLKEEIQESKNQIKTHNTKMTDWILQFNIRARLNESMNKSILQCNKWEDEGKIPIAVSGLALKNILKANPPLCICGARLDDGSDERRHIEKLLEKNLTDSPIIQNITNGRGHWDNITNDVQDMEDTFKKFKSRRGELNTIDRDKYEQKKALEKKYENIDLDDINKKYNSSKEQQNELNSSNQKMGAARNEKEKTELKLEQKEREWKMQTRKNNKYDSQLNRKSLADTLEKIFKRYKDELKDELRDIVAKKTTEYFLKLVSRKEDFVEVRIKDNYKTMALDNNQKNKALSAGQSCCLALAYIAAIRETAKKNYFMMIDSPLHNISQEERVEIAKNLPKFLPQTQITLLVQDQEYTGRANKDITGEVIPSVRDTLTNNNSVWREYVLKTQKEQGSTSHTIIEER